MTADIWPSQLPYSSSQKNGAIHTSTVASHAGVTRSIKDSISACARSFQRRTLHSAVGTLACRSINKKKIIGRCVIKVEASSKGGISQYASSSLTVSRDFTDASSSRARIIIWIHAGETRFGPETQDSCKRCVTACKCADNRRADEWWMLRSEGGRRRGGKSNVEERQHGVAGRRSCKRFFYGSPPPIKTPEIVMMMMMMMMMMVVVVVVVVMMTMMMMMMMLLMMMLLLMMMMLLLMMMMIPFSVTSRSFQTARPHEAGQRNAGQSQHRRHALSGIALARVCSSCHRLQLLRVLLVVVVPALVATIAVASCSSLPTCPSFAVACSPPFYATIYICNECSRVVQRKQAAQFSQM